MFLLSHAGPVRPTMSETTALGAAMAAGAAEGVNVWSLSPSHLPHITSEKYEPQINTDGERINELVPYCDGFYHFNNPLTRLPLTNRERTPLCSMEESCAEVHELGDH